MAVEGWLLDAYREKGGVTLWIKTTTGDAYVTLPHRVAIKTAACTLAREVLSRLGASYHEERGRLYDGKEIRVFSVPIKDLTQYERTVRRIERASKYRLPLYDADIAPQQHFLFTRGISPGERLRIDGEHIERLAGEPPALKQAYLRVMTDRDPRQGPARILRVLLDDETIDGPEQEILATLRERLGQRDPDLIHAYEAFCYLPLLDQKMRAHGIAPPFHRRGNEPLRYRGGSTFYSYGLIKFRDYGVRLQGRLLIDTTSVVGQECDVEALLALSRLSGVRVQHLASRSAGSVFQGALLGRLLREGILVAHKHKPIPEPVSMTDLVAQDRAGISLDARIGVHTDVAEIDFVSMFPHLMHHKNISPEKMGSGERAPDVDVCVEQTEKGHIASVLKRFIDLRMEYKQNPTPLNKRRAKGLKSVLVSANGYLRFREFKLGLSTTHVALCSWVRDAFLTAKELAEEEGFEVVHGLVDSLYLKKPGITREEVEALMQRIEAATGVPIAFEGLFRWIVFPPSANDPDRPVVTRYFGAHTDGSIKVRGIEARQRSQPALIKRFQTAAIRYLARHDADEIPRHADAVLGAARDLLEALPRVPPHLLAYRIRISKQEYSRDIPQRRILAQLRAQGIRVAPGRSVGYVWDAARGAVLPERLERADTTRYRAALARALTSILGSFGHTRESIEQRLAKDEQRTLLDWRTPRHKNAELWREIETLCEIRS